MKKRKYLLPVISLIVLSMLFIQACAGFEEFVQNGAAGGPGTTTSTSTGAEAVSSTKIITGTEVMTQVVTVTGSEVEQSEIVTDTEVEETETITDTEVAEVEIEETVEPSPTSPRPTLKPTVVATKTTAALAKSEPFSATTGLAEFPSYRMTFASDFEGTRQGKPTSGTLGGLLEVTKSPEAQHLRVDMTGDTFSALAPLGMENIEIYDINGTFYLKNPQDGSWLSVPAFLIDSMMPDGMYKPEESIELPVTAVPQPGTEIINGVLAKRYTFGPGDLARDTSDLESVDGTIWVAEEGDYVVKYEAIISGQFENLEVSDVTLLDEGTISMMYDLSDVDGSLTLAPPEGTISFDITKLLFN